jgi:release factor glutamine methyltransferase
MNVSEARRFLIGSLRAGNIENGAGEADWILTRLLNVPRSFILGHPERALTGNQVDAAEKILRRRMAGEPLQYILGEAHFWGLAFDVGEGVLIPRPETELLVKLALDSLPSGPSLFLDWGAGSGCISVALLRERPHSRAVLAEKNPLSLRWAWKNLGRYGLCRRALLWHSRDPGDIPVAKKSFDLVVSNPPYVPAGDIAGLMREVRDHEPHTALDGGEDGMDCHRALFAHAPLWLKKGGTLAVEIGGASQAEKLRNLAPSCLKLVKENLDYSDTPRCMAWVREKILKR